MDNTLRIEPEIDHCLGMTSSSTDVEAGNLFLPKFNQDGLIPAVAIDAHTKSTLMLAWMNREALDLTLQKREAVYYSRSRQVIWHKGATSGQIQKVLEIRVDCDQDALLLFVEQQGGGACHTGKNSCFYRSVNLDDPQTLTFLP